MVATEFRMHELLPDSGKIGKDVAIGAIPSDAEAANRSLSLCRTWRQTTISINYRGQRQGGKHGAAGCFRLALDHLAQNQEVVLAQAHPDPASSGGRVCGDGLFGSSGPASPGDGSAGQQFARSPKALRTSDG